RYVQLEVKTGDEPLQLLQFTNRFTAYPFQQKATFACSDSSLQKIWRTGWRTARLCAQETYYDCPYYEQLQYIGDTRIQALISLYNSGDDRLMRNALCQFDQSRVPDGITQSRYPSSVAQFIPQFSLIWISMIHDYMMHRDDPVFIRQFLPGVIQVLNYFENHLDSRHFVVGIEWLPFVDWANGWSWGVPPGVDLGQSATVSLQFVYALQQAAELFRMFGDKNSANHCTQIARHIQQAVQKHCYVEERGLFADTPEQINFSQHTNILAILTHCVSHSRQQEIMRHVIHDRGLTQCTLYFRFYLFRALKQAGLGDLYSSLLQPWREALDYGLSTFPENPIGNTSVLGTRSDCHAWSASPNYDLLATVCGIEPAAPGFKSVRIEPNLGELKWLRASMPHPLGMITMALEKDKGILVGQVELPPGLKGIFSYEGAKKKLDNGVNTIHMGIHR
ncbi:MAG: alpha-L-rhamnosidase, partial [Calditrichaeota bacterium]